MGRWTQLIAWVEESQRKTRETAINYSIGKLVEEDDILSTFRIYK